MQAGGWKWAKRAAFAMVGALASFAVLTVAWAVTFSPNKGYSIPTPGADSNTWGALLNTTIGIIDTNLGGLASVAVGGNTNVTLSTAQAQNFAIALTGTLTGNIQVLFPNSHGFFFVDNQTSGAYTLTLTTTAGGLTYTLAQGGDALIYVNGADVFSFPYRTAAEYASMVIDTTLSVTGLTTLDNLTVNSGVYIAGGETVNGVWNVVGHAFTGTGWTFNAQGITAAGSNQSTATPVATTVNFVSGATGDPGPGVRLVYAEPGDYEVVANMYGATLPVYPQTGSTIFYQQYSYGVNAAFPLKATTTMACYAQGPTEWYCN